ncbi:MAG: hypothetical protein KatS3mg077_1660 [Candidatus Binatia bacterium]|nr:MAG: hypothetical protein KatS3mg077_1660 [Candidatus Binatia bacterium]
MRQLSKFLVERFWLVAFFVTLGLLLYPRGRALVLNVEVTPARRGYEVALRSGCFTCHGPDGIGGVKNPGSEDEEVPGFAGGVPMMWAQNEQELREYILDGAPARKRQDPAYREKTRRWVLVMPAYRGFLSDSEVDDLVAYIRARSGLVVPTDPLAAEGHELVVQFGCFQCHGPMGSGGPANPGSFKGYIPGWWGHDFRDLVRSEDELREWIREGSIARLRRHPIARRFVEQQRVYMPAYKDVLTPRQLDAIVAYVQWVHNGGWRQPIGTSAAVAPETEAGIGGR